MKPLLLTLCLVTFISNVLAQTLQHGTPVDTRPNEPIRIFSLRLPFKIAPISSKNEITFDNHSGNTWNPTVALDYGALEPNRYKIYTADGVIRSGALRFTHKTTPSSEITFAINTFMLVGGSNLIDLPVSDGTIEVLHKTLFHQNDPFQRLQNTLNQGRIEFTDRQGRNFDVTNGEFFLGTLDVGTNKYLQILSNDKVLLTMNLGIHAGLPLNHFRSHVSVGAIAGAAVTTKLSKKYSITTAIGITEQDDQAIRIRTDRIDFADQPWVGGYRFMMSHDFSGKKGRRFSTAFEMQGMTTPTSTKDHPKGPVDVRDIGLKDFYTPTVKNEDLHIYTSNEERSARGLVTGSEYVTISMSYRFGNPRSAPTLSLYLQEDWKVFYGTSYLPFFAQSDNIQDFGAGVKITQPISWRRKR